MAAAGLDTAAALRERQRLAAREDVEEELFVSDRGVPVMERLPGWAEAAWQR